jgi:hypothetical protein
MREALTDKVVKKIPYRGYTITVYEVHSERFGRLYWADNDIGEPYLDSPKMWPNVDKAIAVAKGDVDDYLKESGLSESQGRTITKRSTGGDHFVLTVRDFDARLAGEFGVWKKRSGAGGSYYEHDSKNKTFNTMSDVLQYAKTAPVDNL